ncbi:MAG TPA: hypothetical protein QF753_14395 [Victivallales bacterium]|nr:hypothetical protein [Victivallales bacterium]
MGNLNLFLPEKEIENAAIFISGSGTNAENILNLKEENKNSNWKPCVIVTDAPLKSRAKEIADKYKIPFIVHDIRQFYKNNGETRVSILTDKGREIRKKWTDELRIMLSPYNIDFGILAGFIPLCNIMADFPCLNVHPGDLTITNNNRRLLVGLHTVPIEAAILNNYSYLRSSVIVAQPYTGKGGNMDSGPILGISGKVNIDLNNIPLDELKIIAAKRPLKRPIGGYKDLLEKIAENNQNTLKENGDWVVFPKVIDDFAANKFAYDDDEKLYFKPKNAFICINTVIYERKSFKYICN